MGDNPITAFFRYPFIIQLLTLYPHPCIITLAPLHHPPTCAFRSTTTFSYFLRHQIRFVRIKDMHPVEQRFLFFTLKWNRRTFFSL
jgi:hypothetical protein